MTEDASRTVTFQLEPDDYLAANRLHSKVTFRRPLTVALLAFIICMLGIFAYFTWTSPPETLLDYIVCIVVFGALCAPVIGHYLYLPYISRRVYRQQKNLHYPVTASWSADGFKTESQRGNVSVPWADFYKWDEDERILLLYHSARLFNMLPRRVFTQAQLADLHQFMKMPRR